MLDFAEIEDTRGSMKIFIFEPHNWSYCGGAVIAIAFSFKEAVEVIIKEAEQEFKKEYFAEDEHDFDGVDRQWDTWLLTHVIETTEVKQRLVTINFNYG